MVKIPTLQPGSTQVRTISPRARKTALPAAGEALQVLGGTVNQIATVEMQKVKRAADFTDKMQADVEMLKGFNELSVKVRDMRISAQDVTQGFDHDKHFQEWDEDLKRIKSNSLSKIRDRNVRSAFEAEFNLKAESQRIDLRNQLIKGISDRGQAVLIEELDAAKKGFAAGNIDLKEAALKLIDSAAASNIISEKEAAKKKVEIGDQWQDALIRNAIATNPQKAQKDLAGGAFEDLTADETAKWIQVAETQIKRNRNILTREREERHLTNEGESLEKLKELSIQDIIDLGADDEISAGFADDMIDIKTDPKNAAVYETDKRVWNEIVRDSVDPETDLIKFNRTLAKAVKNREIQSDDAAKLALFVKGLYQTAISFKAKQTNRNGFIATAMDFIGAFASVSAANPKESISTKFRMTRELVERLDKENIPDEDIPKVSNEIIEAEQKKQNPNRNIEINSIINTPAGAYKVVGYDPVDGEPLVEKVTK